ncbi:Dynamin-like GTPase that mediates homotypic ER fusion [Diplodia seriata]
MASHSMPSVVMNGHFAPVGEKATVEQYDHGVQVIDENKEFKYTCPCCSGHLRTDQHAARISPTT